MSQKFASFKELTPENVRLIKEYFLRRFGVEESYFTPYRFYQIKDVIWMLSHGASDTLNLLNQTIQGHDEVYERVGIRIVRGSLYGPKPTSTFLQILSDQIKLNKVQLTNETLKLYFQREEIDLKKEYINFTDGHVAVVFQQKVIGCGKLKEGKLSSEFPKKLVHNLRLSQL